MSLTDQERQERDPAAIQAELLEIARQIEERSPILLQATEAKAAADAVYDVEKMRLKMLKERRSSLQSVLRSLA